MLIIEGCAPVVNILGVAFSLVVCFPLVVQFGMSFANGSLLPIFGISNLVSLAIWLSLAFGCMFQFPLVTYALIRADIVSQLLLGLPTYLLFEAGLLAARPYRNRSQKKVPQR